MQSILSILLICTIRLSAVSSPDTLGGAEAPVVSVEEPTQTVWNRDTCLSLHGRERQLYNRGRMTGFPLAIRTNLLMPLLNVGVEIPAGRHSSFEADWYYPWLPVPASNRYCFQALALSAGYRFWFSSPAAAQGRSTKTNLTGHSLGISAIGALYDLQWDGDGSQGNAIGGGLDYTYACCVARGRLRMEFSLGFGVVYIEDRPYRVYSDGGALLRESSMPVRHGFVPVPFRCGVTLVVPVGRDGARTGIKNNYGQTGQE